MITGLKPGVNERQDSQSFRGKALKAAFIVAANMRRNGATQGNK
jgi:hypothetical protein